MSDTALAFLFCALAGFSTVLGGVSVFFAKGNSEKFLSLSLAFSGGVMLYVSLAEILQKGISALEESFDARCAFFISLLAFFAGVLIVLFLQKLIPERDCPFSADAHLGEKKFNKKVLMLGIFSALAMAIHNFPEGITTFFSVLSGESFAIPMVVAIAIHNFPEGMTVSAPIYYSTRSKGKAFLAALLSAIAEPIGALIAYLLLTPLLSPLLFGILFSLVAGMMTYLSLVEIIPTAYEKGSKSLANIFVFIGIFVMAISIGLFR